MEKSNRIFSLDLLRVVACLLVVWQHTSEFYYIPSSFRVEANDNTFWVGIMTSIARTSVPLFVMITGYFLLPVSGALSAFFRKRFTRILYPFIAWCIIYAAYYVFYRGDSLQQMWTNILHIPVNFGTQVGHLCTFTCSSASTCFSPSSRHGYRKLPRESFKAICACGA